MGIFIKPMDRIRKLERENARLRALVGEAPTLDQLDTPELGTEGAEAAEQATLVQITEELGKAVASIAEVVL